MRDPGSFLQPKASPHVLGSGYVLGAADGRRVRSRNLGPCSRAQATVDLASDVKCHYATLVLLFYVFNIPFAPKLDFILFRKIWNVKVFIVYTLYTKKLVDVFQ